MRQSQQDSDLERAFRSIWSVDVPTRNIGDLWGIVGEPKALHLKTAAAQARHHLGSKRFWHVNSTATGGGVAEMLLPLLGYAGSLDIDARWIVVRGNSDFFQVTKRIHNALHGSPIEPLTDHDADIYEQTLAGAAIELAAVVKPGEPVVLHDPQTAGLAPVVRSRGGYVIWRCHVGSDTRNQNTDAAWSFLKRYLDPSVDSYVFTRETYAPEWMDRSLLKVIPPSIDPVSAKNLYRDQDEVDALLGGCGLVDSGPVESPVFTRADGTVTPVTMRIDLNGTRPVPADVPVMIQVSRWDRLKDMSGVLNAFAEGDLHRHAHLVLVGPSVVGVSDDPEGGEVLRSCVEQYASFPVHIRERVTLASVPMDDPEQNAAIINALQRRATVIAQKSIAEGFGLTVTEAMFKRKAIIASRVGGIPDQLTDGFEGRLLSNPHDLAAFADIARTLLLDSPQRESLGASAERRSIAEFLMDRHLRQYFELLSNVLPLAA